MPLLRSYTAFILLLIFSACSNVGIEKINGSFTDNPLIIKIEVQTFNDLDASIEYWPTGSDARMSTQVSPDKKFHVFNLQYLTAATEYSYVVNTSSSFSSETSEVYTFETGGLPMFLPTFDIQVKTGAGFDGYIMLRKMLDPGAQLLINDEGNIVWYQLSDSTLFRPFHLTTDSSYLALKSTEEIIEMSIKGDTLLYLEKGSSGFDRNLHHEIIRNSKGQLVALTKEYTTVDLSKFGGTGEDEISGDGIIVLDSLGNKIWHWNIFDHEDLELNKELYEVGDDWSHANAVNYDDDGNFLISFKNFNQIWKIDSNDGKIIWKLGEDGDIQIDSSDYFKGQHAVHINPNGEMMIFDNLYEANGTTRALAFSIDEEQLIARSTMSVELPDSLYSFKQGSVYMIDTDRLLFCSSMTNSIVMTNLEGNVVWQAKSDQSFYRAEYLKQLPYLKY